MESTDSKKSFFKHVFTLEGDAKSEVLNICQYAVLAIIPIILFNKAIRRFSPEVDDKKSSLEITLEILIQVIVIFIALLLIHRVITFCPTYSGLEYPEFSIIQIILIALMFLFSLPTSIGEKANILSSRINDWWSGSSGSSKKKRGGSQQQQPQQQQSAGDGTTPLTPTMMTGSPVQSLPDYNNFYTKDTTPLVGAATPGGSGEGFGPMMPQGLGPSLAQGGAGMGYNEPLAANAVLGGGAFGSAHW